MEVPLIPSLSGSNTQSLFGFSVQVKAISLNAHPDQFYSEEATGHVRWHPEIFFFSVHFYDVIYSSDKDHFTASLPHFSDSGAAEVNLVLYGEIS